MILNPCLAVSVVISLNCRGGLSDKWHIFLGFARVLVYKQMSCNRNELETCERLSRHLWNALESCKTLCPPVKHSWYSCLTVFRCWYSVVLGWCFYYAFYCMITPLPTNQTESKRVFDSFAVVSIFKCWNPYISHILYLSFTDIMFIELIKAMVCIYLILYQHGREFSSCCALLPNIIMLADGVFVK